MTQNHTVLLAPERPLDADELTRLAAIAPTEREALLVLHTRQMFGATIAAATPPRPAPATASPAATSSPPPPPAAVPVIYIPRATREKLAAPAAEGGRHEQAKAIALSLASQGLGPSAVFAQLRDTYPADVTDRELGDIVRWADAHKRQPCRPGGRTTSLPVRRVRPAPASAPARTPETMLANAERFLGGFRAEEADLWDRSPIRPPEDWRQGAAALLEALYGEDARINILSEHTVNEEGKACPTGTGITCSHGDWLDRLARAGGPPESAAGAWFRPNPVRKFWGQGKKGAYTDADTKVCRFLLVESDKLPLDLQLSLLARLPLPVAAITTSAGRSVQGLVRLRNEPDLNAHRARAKALLQKLAPLGFDLANANPSRLARLPGALRTIQASGDGRQRLLYLNPAPKAGSRIL